MDNSNSGQPRRRVVEPLGSSHQQYDPSRSSASQPNAAKGGVPFPWNLTRFYEMTESPWIPRGIVPTTSFQTTGPSFQNYRSNGPLPSECDTGNEDSGYGGSGPPYSSIDTTSVIEDDPNPEAHAAAQLFDSFHLEVASLTNAQPPSWSAARPTPSIATAPPNAEHKWYCPYCDAWLRTKSELKKHNSRHNKPFTCDVPGCNRKEGFGTKNDLDRHKRSVHSDLTVSGPRYVCRLGQCATKSQPKLWPRADNFRSHLRRIHQKDYAPDDDLEEYIDHRPVSCQPALREDLQGVGGTALFYMNTNPGANMQKPMGSSIVLGSQQLAPESRRGIPELQEDLDSILQNSTSTTSENDQPGLTSIQGPDENFLSSNILNGMGQGQLQSSRGLNDQFVPLVPGRYHYQHSSQGSMVGDGDISVANDDDIPPHVDVDESHDDDDGDGDERDGHFKTDIAHTGGPDMKGSLPEQPDVKMADRGHVEPGSRSNLASTLDVPGHLSKDPELILKFLKTLPKHLLKTALNGDAGNNKSTSSSQESVNQKNSHRCTECHKAFNRQCELKKHLKRHEKPYGCTFRHCPKVFGSKNDWKRHESSQHMQLETWKCEELKSGQDEPCAKICHRRESFRNHLNKEHTMMDTKQVEERLDRCRIGRHCDTRYWCGFCRKIIEIAGEGVNAWTIRCDHIDDHFCGREGNPKTHIREWKHLDNEEEKRESNCLDLGKASSSSHGSNVNSVLKRKLNANEDAALHKKQRQEQVYMWTCCQCKTDINLRTSTSCFQCEHAKCKENCIVTNIFDRAEDEQRVIG